MSDPVTGRNIHTKFIYLPKNNITLMCIHYRTYTGG